MHHWHYSVGEGSCDASQGSTSVLMRSAGQPARWQSWTTASLLAAENTANTVWSAGMDNAISKAAGVVWSPVAAA